MNTKPNWEEAVKLACERTNHEIPFSWDTNDRLHHAESLLADMGFSGQTFGVEYVSLEGRELAYLNTGESYQTTVGCERPHGPLFACSRGSWYEQNEQEHEQETGTIRCAYCGEFTEHPDGIDWSDVVCQSCNHCVSG